MNEELYKLLQKLDEKAEEGLTHYEDGIRDVLSAISSESDLDIKEFIDSMMEDMT